MDDLGLELPTRSVVGELWDFLCFAGLLLRRPSRAADLVTSLRL